jgi:hypothetical protein
MPFIPLLGNTSIIASELQNHGAGKAKTELEMAIDNPDSDFIGYNWANRTVL